jgi:hypothetical protein
MKTGMGLTLIGLGLILTFAVTTNTSVFNLHTAGVVFIFIGILGLAIPRRSYAWLGRRMVVQRTRRWPGGRRIEETAYPYYRRQDDGSGPLGLGRLSVVGGGVPPEPEVTTITPEPADVATTMDPGGGARTQRMTEKTERVTEDTGPAHADVIEDIYGE